ncbi:hypothetical protein QNO07_07160 [Streptomyces sp. 549]|uniref:hypothetical protein n=1 Tax=Streptomyces sp. 549 TaxID=3049076 RepID=UPI0024C2AE3B|nr:hypothetical protein [Streptomyces sp. 549]MDK1473202.1 hypothetical protein [Streptomyces sp. 549]
MLTTSHLPTTDATAHPGRPSPLGSADENRLALQAKLTEFGVPPAPGDRTALAELSALDSAIVSTVVQWLAHVATATTAPATTIDTTIDTATAIDTATRTPPGGTQVAPPPPADPRHVVSGAPLPPPRNAVRVDPRLLSW